MNNIKSNVQYPTKRNFKKRMKFFFAGVGYATMTIVFFLDIYYCVIIACNKITDSCKKDSSVDT